jgi:hypothetical protein
MTPLEFKRECLIFSGTEAEEIRELVKPLSAGRRGLEKKNEWLRTFTQERFEMKPEESFQMYGSPIKMHLATWQDKKKYPKVIENGTKFGQESVDTIFEHFATIKGWKKIFDYFESIDREYLGTKKYLIDLRSMDERRQNKESLWQCNDTSDMWYVYKQTGQYVYSRG